MLTGVGALGSGVSRYRVLSRTPEFPGVELAGVSGPWGSEVQDVTISVGPCEGGTGLWLVEGKGALLVSGRWVGVPGVVPTVGVPRLVPIVGVPGVVPMVGVFRVVPGATAGYVSSRAVLKGMAVVLGVDVLEVGKPAVVGGLLGVCVGGAGVPGGAVSLVLEPVGSGTVGVCVVSAVLRADGWLFTVAPAVVEDRFRRADVGDP